MKVFGGYGEYYDQMKLNLAIGSYGGEIWEQCWYALMNPLSPVSPQHSTALAVTASAAAPARW